MDEAVNFLGLVKLWNNGRWTICLKRKKELSEWEKKAQKNFQSEKKRPKKNFQSEKKKAVVKKRSQKIGVEMGRKPVCSKYDSGAFGFVVGRIPGHYNHFPVLFLFLP